MTKVRSAKWKVQNEKEHMNILRFRIAWLLLPMILLLLTSCAREEAAARIDVMLAEPTATAAALANQERAIYVATVAPAKAAADAASITARTQQQIDEEAHAQALRHQGEMAAMTISNTLRLNEMDEKHIAAVSNIQASSEMNVAQMAAEAQRSVAGAWRDTGVYVAIALGALILLTGAALGAVAFISTRAKLIVHPDTGPILITRNGAMLLGRVAGPAIFIRNDGQVILPMGDGQAAVTARQQAFALINGAMRSDHPELARLASQAASAVVQQNVGAPALLSSAVQTLPLSDRQAVEQAAIADRVRLPSFSEIMRSWRPSLNEMLFGFDEMGRPIYGSLDRLLSALVIGRQGQGKTTLLRLIYAQCVMTGVQVIAWDLHGDISDDLPGVRTMTTRDEIQGSATGVIEMMNYRQRIGLKHDKARPVMVLIDELNALADAVPEVIEPIRRIVAEGRKYRMFEFATAKGAPATMFKGSWARDSFSARFAFQTSDRQARMIGFEPEEARKVYNLTVGHALMEGPTPAQIVTFPNVTQRDLEMLLPTSGAASIATSGAASGPLPVSPFMVSREAENTAEIMDSERVEAGEKRDRVREMVKAGKSQRAIIDELWGATGGRGYQHAADELRQIIQELIP